ncbi:MAG: nickel pincer cofactor biosynthesis protein LarC [Leptolyngbyaceae cyanobacterium T60_A2020_046]|nr:nickel pincer cofactor biosynthesis protein LarC [Leptolyngbyaceae cyanobacterium T60_A2020_046]
MKTLKTIAFLDCPTGIAGDMCLGALVDAGVPLAVLQAQINRLPLVETITLQAETVRRNGIAGCKVHVEVAQAGAAGDRAHPPLRHLPEIEALIQSAGLPPRVAEWSLAIFRRLALAEGAVHGIDPQQVHFHEVGASDAIADIVGTCAGFDWLNVDAIFCAPLPMSRGTVRAAHGRLPVPAPAVLKLLTLAQVPVYGSGLMGELITPTGAAIATELADQFGDIPPMTLKTVGLGAGSRDLPIPNLLRLWLGTAAPNPHAAHHHHGHSHDAPNPNHPANPDFEHQPRDRTSDQASASPASDYEPQETDAVAKLGRDCSGLETVTVLETQVDDLSPQAIGYLYDRLLAVGALDVFCQGVTMKKSRPGHHLTVIAQADTAAACEQVLFEETTTLGIRRSQQQRRRLDRRLETVETALGPVRIKLGFDPNTGGLLNVHPEYEDCAAIARQRHLPWRTVHQQALYCWQRRQAEAQSEEAFPAEAT